jgi:hypothetical protein
VSFNKDLSDEEISEYGARARIPMASTNPCYISGAPGREFMISFAHIDESNIDERVALFKALCAAV